MTLQDFQDLLYLSLRIELYNTQVRFIVPSTLADNHFSLPMQRCLDGCSYISIDYRKLIAMLFTCITHSTNYQFAKNKNKVDEFVNIKPLDFPF